MTPSLPADDGGGDGADETDEGNDVMVAGGAAVQRQEVERKIAAESDPGKEQDEADDEPAGPAAVGLLLGKEIDLFAHEAGLLSERSTTGTARSAESSISHNSAGEALAIPEIRFVGNCICLVLYWVATSL